MCGVFAYVNFTGRPVEQCVITRATHTMEHRGPDDYGFVFVSRPLVVGWREQTPDVHITRGAALGHRRLSILDLTGAGRQPISTNDGRYWISYNGEVYNYLELRDELEREGAIFHTRTDTEVVLQAYARWGNACFNRFNGMWGLVIWDRECERLVACRDRFGIKPLVYCRTGGNWAFASEAKALLTITGVSAKPDDEAIITYLAHFSAPPEGHTYYRDISQVPPGCVLEIDEHGHHIERYWRPHGVDQARWCKEADAAEYFSDLFSDAIRLRLRSDVRVGTMVSGGLDSTSVIQEVARQLRETPENARAVGDALQGFHATFPGLPIDEVGRVQKLVQYLSLIVHYVRPMEKIAVEPLLWTATSHLEGPFMNSVPIVNHMLMRTAHDSGVTVVLNGHGADEIFAGYPLLYHGVAGAQFLKAGRLLAAWRQINGMQYGLGTGMNGAFAAVMAQILPYRLNPWNWGKSSDGRPITALRRRPSQENYSLRSMPAHSNLDRLLKRDLFHNVLPSWLNLEDRISMAASVEARLPFLDYRVVEFGLDLADDLKIRDGRTKYLLRRVMENRLPRSIAFESSKFYFSGPDAFWLNGGLKSIAQRLLFNRSPRIDAYLDVDTLRMEFNRFWLGDHRRTKFLWTAFATEYWLENFSD